MIKKTVVISKCVNDDNDNNKRKLSIESPIIIIAIVNLTSLICN